ncbi:MAG: glycosyltransferase family 39 protein [Acidimicrobiales bacterium]
MSATVTPTAAAEVVARPQLTQGDYRRQWWWMVSLLALLGLALRVWYILAFRQDPISNQLPSGLVYETSVWGDGLVFHQQANLLADGEGLISPLPFELQGIRQQSADHPPVYTLYLAFFSLIGVRSELGHMLVSAPLGAMAAITFALLGRRVAGPKVGLIAAAFGALDPNIWPFPGFVLSETVTIPLAALVALFAYRVWDKPSAREAAGLGLMLGLAILARAELAIISVVAIIPLMMLLRQVNLSRRVGLLAIAGLVSGLVVMPWIGYNLSRFEEPVYLSIGLDYSLVQGNCDESYSDDLLGYYWLGCQGEALEGTGLDVADQAIGSLRLREVALDYIAEHPRRAVKAVFARLGRVLGIFHPLQQVRLNSFIAGREPWLANFGVLVYYPMAALAIAGTTILRRRGVLVLPLVGLIVTSLIAVAMTLAVLRYRASAQPALAVLSAVALERGWSFIQRALGEGHESPSSVLTTSAADSLAHDG